MKPANLGSQGIPSGIVVPDRMRVGTLRYTKAGLAWVFFWLLWGDLCFQLMEAVPGPILQLKLKDLGISDYWFATVTATLPSIINTLLNPIISTASDRHRGKRGRRIPFLLYSAPFICGALVLLGFSPDIGTALHKIIGPVTGISAAAMALGTLSMLWILFTVLNMFTGTVYYYFFNDVVPSPFMSRFFGLFRFVASLAGSIYNWFVFEHARTHMQIVFLAAAVVYAAGFLSMCLGIKEGKYPPPPLRKKRAAANRADYDSGLAYMVQGVLLAPVLSIVHTIRDYAKDCLSHRVFIYLFLHNIAWSTAGAIGNFDLLLKTSSLRLEDWHIGKIAAVTSVMGMFLQIPAGFLADRYHPLRLMVWMKIGLLLIAPLNFIWFFSDFSPSTAFIIFIGLAAVNEPMGLLYETVRQPMQMQLWPKGRYGQFCSFNAVAQAFFGIGASQLVPVFMGAMRRLYPDAVYGKDFCYRLMPVWRIPLLCVSMTFLFLLVREWKRLGGESSYKVPGFEHEEAEAAEHAAAQHRAEDAEEAAAAAE
jgi:MFS family permease